MVPSLFPMLPLYSFLGPNTPIAFRAWLGHRLITIPKPQQLRVFHFFFNRKSSPKKTNWVLLLNPLSRDMEMHILHTVLHTFHMELVRRICLNIDTLAINSFILITWMFEQVVIMWREISFLSQLGLKGFRGLGTSFPKMPCSFKVGSV